MKDQTSPPTLILCFPVFVRVVRGLLLRSRRSPSSLPQLAGTAAVLLCLSLLSCRPGQDARCLTGKTAPFRVVPETAGRGSPNSDSGLRHSASQLHSGSDANPAQTVIADLDGDGTLDTLCLYEQATGKTDADGVPSERVRVTVSARPGRFTVVDEDWAAEGKVSVRVWDQLRPPVLGIGVPGSGDLNWYQWDGMAYRPTGAVEPGLE